MADFDPFLDMWREQEGFNLGAFPKYLEYWTTIAASTASVFKVVEIPGYYASALTSVAGTSTAATMSALGAVAAAAIPVITMVGVFVALGSGYYEARKAAEAKGAMTGFSRGFVMGVLNWSLPQVVSHFGVRKAGFNAFDEGIGVAEARGANHGLKAGYGLGAALPDDVKKKYRIALRELANVHASGAWSSDADEAYLQQRNYVVDLAAAGLRYGLIKAE